MYKNDQPANLINKDWPGAEVNRLVPAGNINLDLIRERLAIVIGNRIQSDFEKLCHAVYRLDVSESKFHLVMTEKPTEEIPSSLAELVIEREMQKVRTRIMHKRGEL